jgi:hypothetical protein
MYPVFIYRNGLINTNEEYMTILPTNVKRDRCFGACEYKQRIYFFKTKSIYSISTDHVQKMSYDIEDQRHEVDLPDYGFGVHQLLILNDKLYIQETYYNQISIYSFIQDRIDPSSRYVPSIYPNAINMNLITCPDIIKDDTIRQQVVNKELTCEHYRHINSLCVHPDFPTTLFSTSIYIKPQQYSKSSNGIDNSTIDYIDMNTWTYESYEVPYVEIYDLIYNPYDRLLYFNHSNHIYCFNPHTKETTRAFSFDVDILGKDWSNQLITSRGLCIDENGKMYYTIRNGTPHFFNTTYNPPDFCITILICVNSHDWSLEYYKNFMQHDRYNIVYSSIKHAEYL